ncbi:MAG: hypothetical protein IMZ54_06730 [Acidobacteria bacterium]|nr:hypothetical protein [Acidobacteriota bacterium]MBE3130398.1 hypothetical protein [Acidobacteriota bacterium]
MQTAEIVALIAAIGFLLWAFFKLGRFIVTEWREIEAEEELRRRCPSLRKRGGI